ncbi:MAG: hypothetical protein ABIJ61_02245 [bacterium]
MVRPIEVQDNLAKTPAAERVNQIEKAAPDIDQRQAELAVRAEQAQKQREANEPERTDEVLIRRDHQGKRDDSDKRRKRKRKDKRTDRGLDVTA